MVKPSKLVKHLVLEDAKFDCFKTAAQFFSQASTEGRLGDFLNAVRRIHRDRWPDEEEIDLEKISLSLAIASMSCTPSQDPKLHWETVLDLEYDRIHRPSLRDIARRRGYEHYDWPTTAHEMMMATTTGTDPLKKADEVSKDGIDNHANGVESGDGSSRSADNGADLDFFKPFNIRELLGADAELFLPGLMEAPAIIRAPR
ncbi:hypothetical protein CVT26_004437 [Gymnopilus dilepis]|uniref:Uncharacterized protein n=1 Tax=Gymnopilus dilepis TaxID=231916 RepID=A0A409W6T0_9AGAR|nr:hypothetical protein CVT26_004437 [Gymnopilus dilepis]